MVDLRDQLRFFQKPPPAVIFFALLVQDFDRDAARQLRLQRPVDFGHAADAADLLQQIAVEPLRDPEHGAALRALHMAERLQVGHVQLRVAVPAEHLDRILLRHA